MYRYDENALKWTNDVNAGFVDMIRKEQTKRYNITFILRFTLFENGVQTSQPHGKSQYFDKCVENSIRPARIFRCPLCNQNS